MNQNSRKKTTASVEKDFYQLLNNANFEIDCRNNIDNCVFEPIYNEIGEIGYIKKYNSIFDNKKYSDFSDSNLMREEIEEKYSKLFLSLDSQDPTYEARK